MIESNKLEDILRTYYYPQWEYVCVFYIVSDDEASQSILINIIDSLYFMKF